MRQLDEKRVGLLVRMSYHRACVCSKAIMQPLLRREFVKVNSCGNYELTPAGKKFVAEFLKQNESAHLVTYGGISIGSEVMIVSGKA